MKAHQSHEKGLPRRAAEKSRPRDLRAASGPAAPLARAVSALESVCQLLLGEFAANPDMPIGAIDGYFFASEAKVALLRLCDPGAAAPAAPRQDGQPAALVAADKEK